MAGKKLIIPHNKVVRDTGKIEIADGLKIGRANYQGLLQHLVDRLYLGKAYRDSYIAVLKYIDQEYYSWLLRDAEDAKRQKDNRRGIGVKPVDEKLSLIFAQLDEAVTYLVSVLAPDEAIYSAIAPKEKQPIANGFAALMNQNAKTFQHYRNILLFLLNAVQYNLGILGTHWVSRSGNVVSNDQFGRPVVNEDVVAEGNELRCYDPYNSLFDASVKAVDLAEHGEYFAYVDLFTGFRIKKMTADGELFNTDQLLTNGDSTSVFYESHPNTRPDFAGNPDPKSGTNWVNVLRAQASSKDSAIGYELSLGYFWIIPKDFGLSTSTRYEIWKFCVGNESHICYAEHMDNAHAQIPINIARPYEDHFEMATKGAAERLIPFQRFGSFVMNSHQRATRKKLFGLTLFDKAVIPLMDSDDVDLMGGKIPFNSNGVDMDIRKKIIQFNDAPDTTGTLENIDLMSKIMQSVMPTNIQNQVAGLDRATQYQAAAVVQGANRRNLKMAKTINDQAMNRMRHQQQMNIYQKQAAIEVLTPQGEIIQIDPKQFRGEKIEFTISDGLRGLDKLSLIMNIKEILNAVLQSQVASQQIDVVEVINYWTSLLGDFTDFSQFRVQSPIDTLPPAEKDLAFQLLQQYAEQQKNAPKGQPAAGRPALQLA